MKGDKIKTLGKVILWIVVIILVVVLALFLTMKIAGFDSMRSLIRYLKDNLGLYMTYAPLYKNQLARVCAVPFILA